MEGNKPIMSPSADVDGTDRTIGGGDQGRLLRVVTPTPKDAESSWKI